MYSCPVVNLFFVCLLVFLYSHFHALYSCSLIFLCLWLLVFLIFCIFAILPFCIPSLVSYFSRVFVPSSALAFRLISIMFCCLSIFLVSSCYLLFFLSLLFFFLHICLSSRLLAFLFLCLLLPKTISSFLNHYVALVKIHENFYRAG